MSRPESEILDEMAAANGNLAATLARIAELNRELAQSTPAAPALDAESAEAQIRKLSLYAWIGRDEMGSGEWGIKRGLVPAGDIPLVSISRAKIEPLAAALEEQAAMCGYRIRLVRFAAVEVVAATRHGSD